jgi:2,3-bisphosphoglycerate-independent phosphoglycerate mutase
LKQALQKALLIIIDGFGIAEDPEVSAVDQARKPFYDSLIASCPNSRLSAGGEDVGLPEGQFGNSEVGHLNIGAGRVVWQELSRINKSIREGDFYENPSLVKAFNRAKKSNRIHFMGLFSDGGVHSHNDHLSALLKMAKRHNIENAFVHAFTDGRDTSPHGGAEYLREFERVSEQVGTGSIASIIGRYYAMDRDNRWERTRKAYDLLIHGKGTAVERPADVFDSSYADGVTDEFILPHLIDDGRNSRIRKGDVVVFYNIRGDRARQITKALFQLEEIPFQTSDLGLHYVTFTSYDETFDNHVEVAFPPVRMKNTLGEYVSSRGVRQIRIAETEKYPHVTYFFNGGEETPVKGEQRIMIPSPKVATYDLQPEMSAEKVADTLCAELASESYELAVVNFANPDMVGHTGSMEAAVKAVETVDHQLEKVISMAQDHNYQVLIISDHGNADCMKQPDGSPHTSHTTAPVPAILIGKNRSIKMNDGILADVAPTLLKMMGLPQPEEMTGRPLF